MCSAVKRGKGSRSTATKPRSLRRLRTRSHHQAGFRSPLQWKQPMTDTPRTGPPEKRERRPGQEAAILGKIGKVNSRHNATNSAALSPKIDAMAVNQWRCENGLKLYPALLPPGARTP